MMLTQKNPTPGRKALIVSALIAFMALLQAQKVHAQCANNLSSGPTISPISGSKILIGQTIQIQSYSTGAQIGDCHEKNVAGYMAYPNGTVVLTLTNVSLEPGTAIFCDGTPGGTGTNPVACRPFATTYTVTGVGDVGTTLVIPLPRQPANPQTYLGKPGEVHFFGAAESDGFDDTGNFTGQGVGTGQQFLYVVTPCITINKVCDYPQGQDCFPYGVPIKFRGTICNTGDTTLGQIQVTDAFSSPIVPGSSNLVFAATTTTNGVSTGRPFDPSSPIALQPGECVSYSGSYQPSGSLCGPFTDTISVTATPFQVYGSPRISNTDPCYTSQGGTNYVSSGPRPPVSATCNVCPIPAIQVTKACPPGPVQPGTPLVFSGTVSNAGNVPLTNVIVLNNQPANNTPVFGPINLAVGQVVAFTNSYIVPANSCGPYTDTLTAFGTSVCGGSVTNTDTRSCPGTNSPSIAVTKSCPSGPIQPGQTLTITGTVTNTGNITLTNVVVTNTIVALGGVSRPVLGPITLAPGTGTTFTDSYTVPLDTCGPYRDTVVAYGADKCFGRIVTATDFKDCPGTNSPSIVVTKSCPPGPIQPGQTLNITGTVTNTGNITLTNVTVTNTISVLGVSRQVLAPITLAPGAGTTFTDSYTVPLDSCGPYRDTVFASGADKCFGRIVTSTDFKDCPGTNSPSIVVTKSCPPGPIQPGQTLNITGTVTNTGNITLTNVLVTNTIAAINSSRRVLGPVTLAPGAGMTFTDNYVVPLDSCGPYRDTVVALGADKCFGRVVTATDFKDCPGTNSPAITVSKSCPPNPVPPGGTLIITGVVSNSGNITLTNVTVTNVIAAISQSHAVLGPITLLPGQSVPFTDRYTVPLDTCGPYLDTVLAVGADKCFGRIVTASDFKNCLGISSPRIAVTKRCPDVAVVPGGTAVFSGTVSNAGNITLTNVIVVNNRPTNNTPVFGPVTLAPGEVRSFTGSEVVPPNCCEYFDTLTATGVNKCTGSNVVATASAACPTLVIPKIVVTKNCPANPVPLGQSLVFSGTVSNAGNIALIGVTIVDNQPSNNTPVLGPITLAPGESVPYLGSFVIPINICDTNIADTVTARGTDICAGSNVVSSASALCPIIPVARLSITKRCPANPVAPGELLTYSGTVSNSGTITITNVTVVNDRPVPDTVVLTPTTLVPGQSVNFSGSYRAPYDCCGPCVDTLTARGNDICLGSNVMATASAACPRSSTPALAVTRDCPPGQPAMGELVFFTGIVTNSGNATLVNVTILDDQAGNVLDNLVLAPGEAVPYMGMYIPTNCGPNLSSGVTAIGADVCTGNVVSNRFVASCSIVCPSVPSVTLTGMRVSGNMFVFSFQTAPNHTYTVQYTDGLTPVNWQSLPSVPGDGSVFTVSDPIVSAVRFYRVLIQ